jgi:hypothetical protein
MSDVNPQVWTSDVWKDKTGKHWRVLRAHRTEGDVTIIPCNKVTGIEKRNAYELVVPRAQFLTDYAYAAHANI